MIFEEALKEMRSGKVVKSSYGEFYKIINNRLREFDKKDNEWTNTMLTGSEIMSNAWEVHNEHN